MAYLIDNKMWQEIKRTREESLDLLRKMVMKSITLDGIKRFLIDTNTMLENATVKMGVSQRHALGNEAFFEDFIATIKILLKVVVSCKEYKINFKKYFGGSNSVKLLCKELRARVDQCNIQIGLGIDIKETIRISSDPNGNSGPHAVLGGQTNIMLTPSGSITTNSVAQTDPNSNTTIVHTQQHSVPKARPPSVMGSSTISSTFVQSNDGYTPSYLMSATTTATPQGNVTSYHTAQVQSGQQMMPASYVQTNSGYLPSQPSLSYGQLFTHN